jgi:hypothetical protein
VVLLGYHRRHHDTGEAEPPPSYDVDLLRADPLAFVLFTSVPNFSLYRRASFLRAGGFDTNPKVLYNEDDAFHQRMALAGLSFDADPEVASVMVRYGNSMSTATPKRLRAEHEVLCQAVDRYPQRYRPLLERKIWSRAAYLAVLHEWELVGATVELGRRFGGRIPPTVAGSAAFRLVATLAPVTAFQVREAVVSRFRPHLVRHLRPQTALPA